MDSGEEQFFVDSKPIEVCRVARGRRCKMERTGDFSQAPDFGFCASQNMYYFGYRLHALCGLSGVIHSYDLSKASVADLHYMKDVRHVYRDCSVYGDKGYIGADVQLDLFETAHIRLECPYRLNQKNWRPTFIPKKENLDTVLTTYRPIPGHQELRENNGWLVCQDYWQNQCTCHSAICKLHKQQAHLQN